MNAKNENERDLYRIMVVSTSLGFGALAVFLYSVQDLTKGATLKFSADTVVAFVLGYAAGWLFFIKQLAAKRDIAQD